MSTASTILLDLYRGGAAFFMGGVRSKLSRAETVQVKINGNRRVFVRPRESDFATLRQVFMNQEYCLPDGTQQRVQQEYEKICASGLVPVIVDAGANIGAASIWLKEQFPKAAIVAIEPDPSSAAIARKNVAGLPAVTVLEAAVGGEAGFVSMAPAAYAWAVRTERAEAGCAVVTIDQAVATVPSGKLFLAKIDIEGFESDLFAGDLRWLDDAFAVYIEPHDWMLPGQGSSRSFQAAFGARDFEIFLRGENLIYIRRSAP